MAFFLHEPFKITLKMILEWIHHLRFQKLNVFLTKKIFKHVRCINLFLGHSDSIFLKEQANIFSAVLKEDGKNVIIIKMTSWIL